MGLLGGRELATYQAWKKEPGQNGPTIPEVKASSHIFLLGPLGTRRADEATESSESLPLGHILALPLRCADRKADSKKKFHPSGLFGPFGLSGQSARAWMGPSTSD
jgi:hypothetical protein